MTDGYSEWIKGFKAGGVPTVKLTANGFETGIARFVEPIADELKSRMNLEPGDMLLLTADTWSIATKAIGELRNKLARDLDLIPEGQWKFVMGRRFPHVRVGRRNAAVLRAAPSVHLAEPGPV
jgi:aspartyl-tRNA synthetase